MYIVDVDAISRYMKNGREYVGLFDTFDEAMDFCKTLALSKNPSITETVTFGSIPIGGTFYDMITETQMKKISERQAHAGSEYYFTYISPDELVIK
jgi:hypothetical protein